MNKDPKIKRPSPGTYDGVHIDQVLGEWWLGQVGLRPILPPDKTRRTLASLFRYNFLPDVGPYRKVFRGGRWYAAPGDPGLLMATFPFGGGQRLEDARGAHGYLNECMSGFEWQAAAHMIHAGLVEEGLQVVKALDTRYSPEKRNSFNEIECGDHYGRALASYGVLIALSGYRHDGPAGRLAFAPRFTPENFRAPFTVAEGWGTFGQKRGDSGQTNSIAIRYGRLRLRELTLELPPGIRNAEVGMVLDNSRVNFMQTRRVRSLTLAFDKPLEISSGQSLLVTVAPAKP
jgi:hypothetical protein